MLQFINVKFNWGHLNLVNISLFTNTSLKRSILIISKNYIAFVLDRVLI